METSEQTIKPSGGRRTWLMTIALALILVGGAAGAVYFTISSGYVYTDKGTVTAPSIALSASETGLLQELYVNNGDIVPANTPVARVGNEILKTQTQSLVVNVQNNIGKSFDAGNPVVTVIDPSALRVEAQVSEDKGLSDIAVGDKVKFTVDGFSKDYQGVVDEISQTSHEGDVVFNISDQRQVSSFDVKVRYNTDQYPELKNGMTAKVWIYKQ